MQITAPAGHQSVAATSQEARYQRRSHKRSNDAQMLAIPPLFFRSNFQTLNV